MFHNKSAWFSSSVPQECRTFWMMEGGTMRCWKTADYLFSQDALCPDTIRIYSSRDHLFKNVTVFHSFFLSVCEKRKSFQSVCIGHYVLPPDSVQEEVRGVIGRMIWECDDLQGPETVSDDAEDEHSDGDASQLKSVQSDTSLTRQQGGCLSVYPSNNMLSGHVSMDNLPKYTGPLSDLCAGCFRCCARSSHFCVLHT